jgi:ParB-like chromosome segregation protein Spo0J
MNITKMVIDDLTLDPNNARKHDDKNLKAIAESLKQFGQRKPIVVWRNTVIAGNGTIVAARSLGWIEIDVSIIPEHWEIEKVKAYALADNRTAELATWDKEVLSSQLIELSSAGFDMQLLAFEVESVELPDNLLDDSDEARLDQRATITCPSCACEFRKTASGFEVV